MNDKTVIDRIKICVTKRKIKTSNNPTLTQALKTDWPRWKIPIEKELQMLKQLDCYEVVYKEHIPKNAQIIPTKLDLKEKIDSVGKWIKDKARLLVLGNLEWSSTRDVFAPTANIKTLNLMFSLAAQHNLILYGLDIFGAFITADIDNAVYIQLPHNLETCEGTGPIWKLKKTLYGLNRSPKAFNDQLSAFLIEQGYKRSTVDRCLFYKRNDKKMIMFCIHVDDFAIASSHQHLIKELCDKLKTKYIISESDNLESFLGIHIVKENNKIYLSQPGHIDKIIKEARLTENMKDINTPMKVDFNDKDQDDSPRTDENKFRSLLGLLIFLLRTRPDISYAINRLATRSTKATEKDLQALKRVVHYIISTKELELVYSPNDQEQCTTISELYAWADAAYNVHQDSKSHSGICFRYGDTSGMFHSNSQKHKIVSLSSTEAEIIAAVEATKDIIYLRGLLDEIGYTQIQPTTLYADNKSLIILATKYSGNHKKVKHYLARINFMIEQVNNKVIRLEYLQSKDQKADLLTKPLGPQNFIPLRNYQLGPQR